MSEIQLSEGLITIRDAAHLLCVHANTLRRWSDEGLIKTYRFPLRGDRRYQRQDVLKLLTRMQSKAAR